MIKYVPSVDPSIYIEFEQITFPVPSRFDWVTVDKYGSVYGWVGSYVPRLAFGGEWIHGNQEFENTKTLIGQFERDDGQEFEPQRFSI